MFIHLKYRIVKNLNIRRLQPVQAAEVADEED